MNIFNKLLKRNELTKTQGQWLIVGLGNPGKQYEKSWHNLGFMTLDYISQKFDIPVNKIKFKGLFGQGKINGQNVILLKPTTYMNNSGESVGEAASFYKIKPENIIVIYDDIDIALGKIRIRHKGSAGTHNGMRSVIKHLNTDDFPRIRIGCGPLPQRWDIVDYVLSSIPKDSWEIVFESIQKASEAASASLKFTVDKSMNIHNKNEKA